MISMNQKQRLIESDRCVDFSRQICGPFKGNGHEKKTIVQRFFEKIGYGMSDCWFWFGGRDQTGYGRMRIKNYTNENFAHRISWELHNGKIPNGMKVLHKCDVPNCVNPDHLFLGTQQDNMKDMVEKGHTIRKAQKGVKNGCAKLNDEKILEIRKLYKTGDWFQHELAKKFGVAQMTICRVVNQKLWSHV